MSDERRTSFRCHVQTDEQSGSLHLGKGMLKVRILEESAGGYGVECDRLIPGLKVGQSASLMTDSGCCEVRVAHVTTVADHTRIGLRRHRELTATGGKGDRKGGRREGVMKMIVLTVLFLSFFAWGFTLGDIIPSLRGADATKPAAPPQHRQRALAVNFLKLDKFKSQDIAEKLGFSPEQQASVSHIARNASLALTELYDRRDSYTDEEWTELGMRLIQISWAKIRNELTDEQLKQWDELLLQ